LGTRHAILGVTGLVTTDQNVTSQERPIQGRTCEPSWLNADRAGNLFVVDPGSQALFPQKRQRAIRLQLFFDRFNHVTF
jgi:hypothetical protein